MARGITNNVKAGAFLLGAIALGFAMIVVIASARERLKPRTEYVVRFDLVTGAGGLDEGSVVQIAGRPVGVVSRIDLRTEPRDNLPPGVDVHVRIDRDLRLYPGVVAYLDRPLLGAGGVLNLPGVGDAAAGAPLPADAVIPGTTAPPAFLAGAGYGDQQKAQLQNILRRADELTANLADASASVKDQVVPDVREIVADVRQRSATWFDRVDSITASVDQTAAKGPKIADDVQARLDQLKDLFASGRSLLDDNRPRIDNIARNVDEFTDHLNQRTKVLLDDMLDEGDRTATAARQAIERVDALIAEQTPNLRRMVANARLGTDQLKLTLAEVRRSPWRLLYRPDTQEVEFELLYDAARTYAEAVSDLRAAGDALREMRAADALPAADAERLMAELQRSFERYGQAEKAFLDLVVEHDAKE